VLKCPYLLVCTKISHTGYYKGCLKFRLEGSLEHILVVIKFWNTAGCTHCKIAEVHVQTGSMCAREMVATCNKSTFTLAQNVAVGFFLSPASISNFRVFFHFQARVPLFFFSPLSGRWCRSISFVSPFFLKRSL